MHVRQRTGVRRCVGTRTDSGTPLSFNINAGDESTGPSVKRMLLDEVFTRSADRDTQRPWTTPWRGRPDARTWRGSLPACPPLVRRGRAVPVDHGICRGIRRKSLCDPRPHRRSPRRQSPRPRNPRRQSPRIHRRNFRPGDIPSMPNALSWQPPRRALPNAPSWREPLPACPPLGRHGPAGLVVHDSVRRTRHDTGARNPTEPASAARGTAGRPERANRKI